MSEAPAPIQIRILSQPRFLCVARAAISAAVDRIGCGEALCGQVMLALDEAVTNVIRHGYHSQPDRPIWISFIPLEMAENGKPDCNRFQCSGFRIIIEDEARQVDPSIIKSRDLQDIRPGGLGVHIIQQIMDEVEYSPRPTGGMRLVMTKMIPDKQTAGHPAHRGPNP